MKLQLVTPPEVREQCKATIKAGKDYSQIVENTMEMLASL